MKKLIFIILFAGLLMPYAGYCQLEKGDLLGPFSVGVSYYHQVNKATDYKATTGDIAVSLNDALGIFVANRLAIGPGFTFLLENNHQKYEGGGNTDEYNNFSYSFIFSPFIRYYFAKSGKLAFFIQGSGMIGYGQNIWKIEDSSNKTTTNSLKFGGGAGIGMTYFFNNSIGLETQLQYDYIGSQNKSKSRGYDDKVNINNNMVIINVGLAFYLQPGK